MVKAFFLAAALLPGAAAGDGDVLLAASAVDCADAPPATIAAFAANAGLQQLESCDLVIEAGLCDMSGLSDLCPQSCGACQQHSRQLQWEGSQQATPDLDPTRERGVFQCYGCNGQSQCRPGDTGRAAIRCCNNTGSCIDSICSSSVHRNFNPPLTGSFNGTAVTLR